MSLKGAMIEAPFTPPVGSEVQLVRGSLIANGKIMWSSDDRCGLRFNGEVTIKQWLAPPSRAQQQRVDEIVALVKAGAIPATLRSHDDAETPNRGQHAVALNEVVRLLEALGDDLSSSEETLALHGSKLQNLDIAMQMVKAVVRELNGEGHTPGADLSDLRVVCEQALARK